jgi:enamine deaminase RidA (YjgF/YER057c/UK114 family)
MTIRENLIKYGLKVPEISIPLASYIPAVKCGNMIFVAGQLPIIDGKLAKEGKVGNGVTEKDAKDLAQICALNALAAISLVADLDQIERVVKVCGFVNCAPGFIAIPGVIDGASEFLIKIFGDINGKHARTAVGVAELPLNAPVEVEVIFQLKN